MVIGSEEGGHHSLAEKGKFKKSLLENAFLSNDRLLFLFGLVFLYWKLCKNLYDILQRKWGVQCPQRPHLVLSTLLVSHPSDILPPQ